MTKPILLLAINARYSHTAHGIRCLRANMHELRERTLLREFDLRTPVETILVAVTKAQPAILGVSVYLWNVAKTEALLRLLRAGPKAPVIVLGGPEASWLPENHPLAGLADHIITGEGETAFPALCRRILAGTPPDPGRREAPPPDPAQLRLPDEEYTDQDLAHRLLYVESSRGCPYRCSYCLSANDRTVRLFPLTSVRQSLERLLQRGARRFRFLDRTFNACEQHACDVLEFLAGHAGQLDEIHLELAPKPLGNRLQNLLCRFPPARLHIEVGIQTYDPDVSRLVQRPFDPDETDRMLKFLLDTAKAAVHADLIAGLPGETPEGFARGFDRLLALGPREIQLGLLKRLHGAPITGLAAPWNMRYNEHPPYDVLATAHMDASTIQRLKIMARYWDMLHNRGRYPRILAMILNAHPSPFQAFLRLSDWLHNRLQATHAIPMLTMMRALLDYLTGPLALPPELVATALLDDYEATPGHIKAPRFAKDLIRKR